MRIHHTLATFIFSLALAQNAHAAAGVATAHPLATTAGVEILEQGGNAFDAAVAISAALAVVEPTGSGLGGGGFWLLHDATSGEDLMLDGRERAPLAASRDMYLDSNNEVVPGLSVDGPLAAGIPGQPAALAWLATERGNLGLAQSLGPAIRYAEDGIAVGDHYVTLMDYRLDAIRQSPAAAAIFLDNNAVPEPGWILKQPELANVLRQLANHGRDGFYRGEIADLLVEGVQAAGGIWTREDLAAYQVVAREPIVASYDGMTLTSATLPSSGGLVMAIALNILSEFDLDNADETTRTHLLVEAMRRAYRDRAEYMGDSDFVDVAIDRLSDIGYGIELAAGIEPGKATPSDALRPVQTDSPKATDTTHFSVVDDQGNRVAATLSINYPFGSAFAAPGTGVLLNDEMDDFSAKPGEPNVYGLVGAEANAIAPGKRMLSSMSPSFFETENRIAVVGTPGGSRIISMVLQAALAFNEGASAEEIVARPRIHHQYLPDRIQYEPDALSAREVVRLYNRGHRLEKWSRSWGNMHIVVIDKGTGAVTVASDPRVEGEAQVIE